MPQPNHDKPQQLSKGLRVLSGARYERRPKDQFTYQRERDSYVCPQGRLLQHSRYYAEKQLHFYTARASDCRRCPRKTECTRAQRRVVSHTASEGAREATVREGPRYREVQRARRINEHLPRLGKRDHNLSRARSRGLEARGIQAALTALALDLKKAVAWGGGFVLDLVLRLIGVRTGRGRHPALP